MASRKPSVGDPLGITIVAAYSAAPLSQSLSQGGTDELAMLINETSEDELLAPISKRAADPSADVAEYIRALMKGLACEGCTHPHLRLNIFKHVLELLDSGKLVEQRATDCLGILDSEADGLTEPECAQVIQTMVDNLTAHAHARNTARSFELLPKLLAGATTVDNVDQSGIKHEIINKLATVEWPRNTIINLITILRELALSDEELSVIVSHIVEHLHHLELQELPSAVYQLLLLVTKGHRKRALVGLIGHFNQLEKASREADEQEKASQQGTADIIRHHSLDNQQLKHVEGTVLLHILFAIKQDQELGKELLKLMKQAGPRLSPFMVALLLTLARVQQFEEPVFELIRASVQQESKERCKVALSVLWRAPVGSTTAAALADGTASTSVSASILETVSNSAFGWDHITQSLVQLGVLLIDSAPSTVARSEDTTNPSYLVVELGVKTLAATFQAHRLVRAEVLEQVFSRVLTKAPNVHHYITLLATVAKDPSQPLVDHLPRLKEAFDYLSYLTPSTAVGLLEAVLPLLQSHSPFLDHVILVLRKSMFSREEDARLAAVSGFLLLLRKLRPALAAAAPSATVTTTSSKQEAIRQLRFEVLGYLRRCLAQQASVRDKLYTGLPKLLKEAPELEDAVLDLLLSQFSKYLGSSSDELAKGGPPLLLDYCVEVAKSNPPAARAVEPLPSLLTCMVHCAQLCGVAGTKGGLAHQVQEVLRELIPRVLKADPEDWELDASTDFSPNTPLGLANQLKAEMLLGAYEVLTAFAAIDPTSVQPNTAAITTTSSTSSGSQGASKCPRADVVGKLFTMYQNTKSIMKHAIQEAAKAGGGEGAGEDAEDVRASAVKGKAKPATKRKDKPPRRAAGRAAVTVKVGRRLPMLPPTLYAALVSMLFGPDDDDQETDAGASQEQDDMTARSLRENYDYVKHLLTTGIKLIHKMAVEATEADSDTRRNNVQFCQKVAQGMYHYFIRCLSLLSSGAPASTIGKPEHSKVLATRALECFHLACSYIATRNDPALLARFLKETVPLAESDEPHSVDGDTMGKLHEYLCVFENLVQELADDEQTISEAEVGLHIVATLYEAVGTNQPELLASHFGWLETLCRKPVHQPSMEKLLFSLVLKLASWTKKTKPLARLASELGAVLNKETEEYTKDPSSSTSGGELVYAFITSRTAGQLATAFLNFIDGSLDEIGFLFKSLSRGRLTTFNDADDAAAVAVDDIRGEDPAAEVDGVTIEAEELSQRLAIERNAYRRLHTIVKLLHSFVQFGLPRGPAEAILKTFTKLYKELTAAVRRRVGRGKSAQQALQPVQTEVLDLVHATGQLLTPDVRSILQALQRDTGTASEGSSSKVNRAKLRREGTRLPQLIYHLEKYEDVLLKLQKSTNLELNYFVNTTNRLRTFQIAPVKLSSEKTTKRKKPSGDADEEENPPAKRKRTV